MAAPARALRENRAGEVAFLKLLACFAQVLEGQGYVLDLCHVAGHHLLCAAAGDSGEHAPGSGQAEGHRMAGARGHFGVAVWAGLRVGGVVRARLPPANW